MPNLTNKSGINPKGHTVLILPKEVAEKTSSGIIISSSTEHERLEMAQMYAVVVAVSPVAWSDQEEPFAKVGDEIIFTKYAGHLFEGKDGVTYRLINDLDVKATLDKDEE